MICIAYHKVIVQAKEVTASNPALLILRFTYV
jgi:hypothetical protein